MKQKAVCVLGMHRSGTSCLAGSLESAGLFMGNISLWNRHNTKGNREHHEIVALHNRLLADNHSAWDQPLEPIVWSQEHRSECARILLEFESAPLWGFKDPRTVLTYEGWLEAVPELEFVGTFRHPSAVAASLKSRSKLTLEKSLQLWMFYNQRILRAHQRQPFPLLCFDLPPARLREQFKYLFEALGLNQPDEAEIFFDEGLKHFNGDPAAPLPDEVNTLYADLCKIAF